MGWGFWMGMLLTGVPEGFWVLVWRWRWIGNVGVAVFGIFVADITTGPSESFFCTFPYDLVNFSLCYLLSAFRLLHHQGLASNIKSGVMVFNRCPCGSRIPTLNHENFPDGSPFTHYAVTF